MYCNRKMFAKPKVKVRMRRKSWRKTVWSARLRDHVWHFVEENEEKKSYVPENH